MGAVHVVNGTLWELDVLLEHDGRDLCCCYSVMGDIRVPGALWELYMLLLGHYGS